MSKQIPLSSVSTLFVSWLSLTIAKTTSKITTLINPNPTHSARQPRAGHYKLTKSEASPYKVSLQHGTPLWGGSTLIEFVYTQKAGQDSHRRRFGNVNDSVHSDVGLRSPTYLSGRPVMMVK